MKSLNKIISIEDSFIIKQLRNSFILNWLRSKPQIPLEGLLNTSFLRAIGSWIIGLIEKSLIFSLTCFLYATWLNISFRWLTLFLAILLALLVLMLTIITAIPLYMYILLIVSSLGFFSLFIVYPRLANNPGFFLKFVELAWDMVKKHFVVIFWSFFPFFDLFFRRFTPLGGFWDEIFILWFLFLAIILGVKNRVKMPAFTYYLLFFYLILIFSSLLSPYPILINIEGVRGVLMPTLIFFIIYIFSKMERDLEIGLSAMAISCLFLGLIGIAQYIMGFSMPAGWVDVDFEAMIIKTRAFSIIGSPNFLAAYLLFGIGASLSLLLTKKSIFNKVFWTMVLVLNVLSLFYTFARGSFLALGGSLGLLSVLVEPTLIFLLIAGVVSVYLFLPNIVHRVLFLFSPEYLEKSLQGGGRLYRYLMALEHIKSNLLIGSGPGTFGGGSAIKHGFFQGISVDSYHLRVLAETGFLGYLSFVGLFLSLFRYGLYVISTTTVFKKKAISMGILMTILAIFFHSTVENLLDAPGLVVFLFLFAALLVVNAEE